MSGHSWGVRLVPAVVSALLCLLTVATSTAEAAGSGAFVFSLPFPDWGMARRYDDPMVDMICAGHFQGEPQRFAQSVPWYASSTGRLGGDAVPSQASFIVDNVIRGEQDTVGNLITVRYSVPGSLLPDKPNGQAEERPLGSLFYRDIPATVAGRRCLLILVKDKAQPDTYEVFEGIDFMVAGEKPVVEGWAGLAPMKRLELEFASAVRSHDPAVAYLATMTACTTHSPAVGPELVSALRQNMTSSDGRLQAHSVAGLLKIGDLDTIYDIKGIFERWQKDPKMARWCRVVGGDGLDMVKSKNAVPALVELTSFPDPGVRFGATVSLRQIGGRDAVAALAGRLDDESSSVRYQAIQGLAKSITPGQVGVPNWKGYAPNAELYEKDPATPLNNWKRWWEQKGKSQYPTVESTIIKAQRFRTERPWAKTAEAQSASTAP